MTATAPDAAGAIRGSDVVVDGPVHLSVDGGIIEFVPQETLRGPLVGRQEDLSHLREILLGEGGRLLLSGDAGIGKTRLLAELVDDAVNRGWRVLTGHCVGEGGASLPYLPFSEVFVQVGRDPAVLDALVHDHPPLTGLLPGRAPADAIPVERAALVGAVQLSLESLARLSPVLLVIEDVHWADESSRDLITTLLTRSLEGPISLVVSYRSDDLHRRHPLRQTLAVWSRLAGLHRLELQPLPAPEMSTLVHGLRGESLSEPQVEDVVARAEGNAFFAEELAAAVAIGCCGASEDLSRLLLTRVDQLDEGDQHLIRLASVAGRRVGHRLLAAVAGTSPGELDGALRRSIERNILTPSGRDGYVFRHALLAESVYDDLLPGERVRSHGAYAAALAADPTLGTAADLARHAAAAGDREVAGRASAAAGRAAMQVGGAAEALRHFEAALEVVVDDDALDELTVEAARAATGVGRLDRALALLRARLDADTRTAPASPGSRAELVAQLAFVLRLTEEDVDRVALTSDALALVTDDVPVRARLLGLRAEALMDAGRDDEAARAAGEAMELAVRLDLREVQSDLNGVIARLAELEGDAQASLRRLESVVETWGDTTDIALLRAMHQIGLVHVRQGRLGDALAAFRAGADRARAVGLPWAPYGLDARTMAATTAYEMGEWDLAQDLTDRRGEGAPDTAVAALDAVGAFVEAARGTLDPADLLDRVRPLWAQDGMIAIQAGSAALEAWGNAGELDRARAVHDEVLDFLREIWQTDHPDVEVRLNALLLGHLATQATDGLSSTARAALAHEAEALYAAGEAVWPEESERAPGLEGRAWQARLRAEWRRVQHAAGLGPTDPEDLLRAWREAVTLFTERGNVYESARSRGRLAAAFLAAGRREEAGVHLASARETAARLGAGPLLAELDALVRRLGRTGVARGRAAGADAPLTPRELEVLHLLGEGRTNGQIGSALFISTKTASVHVSSILAKLGAQSRGEAVSIARATGVLMD